MYSTNLSPFLEIIEGMFGIELKVTIHQEDRFFKHCKKVRNSRLIRDQVSKR